MTDNAQALAEKYHVDLYGRFPLTLNEGKGCHVTATNGKTYLDALAGIAVNALGYAHPAHVKAIQEQAGKLIHTSNFFYNEPQSQLAKMLADISGLDRAFFCNSGAEAIEGAVKLARKYGHANGKSGNILSMENCFHGRTIGAIAMGKKKYQKGFAPLAPGFKQVPMNNIKALKQHFNDDTVAIILETVQGEGGVHPADEAYLKTARELCDAHDALLILDEIQCGIGRTGTMFAYQQYNIMPDLVTSAKALGGGVPIGAVMAHQKVADAIGHGEHGTTYGGNPLACRAAVTTLQTILDEKITGHVVEMGHYFMDKLNAMAEGSSAITDVRGRGLMIGVELAFPGADVVNEMLQRGVISNCASGKVMRIVPPLIISKKEIDTIVEALQSSIKEVEHQHHEQA